MPPSIVLRTTVIALGVAFLPLATSRGQESNLALGKPVVASAATYAGQIPENLTDGQFNNQSHPLTATGTIGFYYRIDLGKDEALSRIIMYNRTGCCPERLSNYRVALLADSGGSPGAANWTADIRTDNSHSGDGGTDILTPDLDPSGEFRGRYIHIENLSNAAYNPQIAEVEAYPAQLADIRFFTTDAGNITATGDPDLPAQATLSWQADDYESLEITPDIGAVPGPAGTRVVMPAATTTYTLRATNEGGTITQTVTIGVDAPFAPPLITEFAAENAGSILDEDGDKSDWIEIYNPNGYHLPLSGFYLTDNPDNLSKWAVGGLAIPPGGYSVVFASEKDRADPAGELHTNFRLSRGGEYVALVAPDGLTVLSQFPADFPDTAEFPPQKAGASYGIASGGGAAFLSPPTPGTANGGGFSGFVADTQFSVDRGFYTDPIQVEVTTATPGAEIRYTTDGTAPTAATGTVYAGPISVGSTTVLRAAAFLPGYIPTNIDTHTYIFVADVAQNPVLAASIRQDPTYGPQIPAALLSLPSLSITTPSAINGNTEVGCSLEMVFPDGTPGFQEDCGVKNYGGAFTNFPKKNFRLYFRGEYGATKLDYPIFAGHERDVSAPGRFDALELRSGSHDMKMRGFYMANRFCDDTMLDMGDVNPHGRFVHLYINGTYWGQYHLRERFNAAMFASYLGGSKEDYEAINGNWNVGGWADPGTPYDGTGAVWENTKALALSASPDNYPATLPWLNMQSLVDFMAVFMYGYAEHEYRTVAPARPGSGLEFYQNDADGFFGTAFGGTRNPTEFASQVPGVFGRTWADGPGSLFSLLYKAGHPDFRTLVADRLHKHYANGGAMTDEAILARLQERLDEVQLSMIPEIARWGGPNNTDSYQTVPEWQAKVDLHVNSWIPGHSAARVAQFKAAGFLPATDAPAFSQHGGAVAQGYPLTMQANAPVYYTTDGTDPRLPGGALSPSALLYEPPVLTNPVSLVGDTTGVRGIVPADNSVDATWTAAGFDDSAWASAAGAGVGYDEDTTYVPYIDLNVGAAMNDTSMTAYLRYAFTIDDPAALTNLTLAMRYDDGFVAYLNGTRIASANAPATLDFQAGATAQHADGEAVGFAPVAYEHPDPASLLVAGQNVLAIHGLNYLITSSDFLIEPQLTAYEIEDIGGSPPVAINAPTVVKARAQGAGGEWSALTEAFFAIGPAVQPGDVGVAEIHYNPDGQSESTEFIELINLADHAINLRGALFTDGIEFAFPALRDTLLAPGQRFLLAGSRYGMDGEYGPGLPVGGLFRDNLSNDGETLTLEDGQGNVLFTLTYNDQLPWPTAADGDGYSLANINPTGDPADPANWRSGAATGGSPGAPDPGSAFAGDPQGDGDFDSIPALAEFAMGTSDAAADANPIALTPPAPGESGYTFSFPRDPTALGVRLFPEVSGDMIGWDQDSPALTYLGETRDASGIATVRYRLDPAGTLQHFVRLVAEPTPVLP